MISNIYNTCVKVCFLSSKDQQLYSYTINNKCNENILLLKTSEDHYDTLYTIGRYENLGLCQNIVLNLMVKAIGKKEHGEWTDLNMNRYINLEYEVRTRKFNNPRIPRNTLEDYHILKTRIRGDVTRNLSQQTSMHN